MHNIPVPGFLFLIDQRISTQNKIIEQYKSLIKGLTHFVLNGKQANTRLKDCVACNSSTLTESEFEGINGLHPVYGATGIIAYSSQFAVNEIVKQDELNEKRTLLALELEKLKTEEISKLRDGFADNIQKEYDKIRSKIDKLTQTELKLVEWQQELDNNKKIFQKDRELFDSQKEKLLNDVYAEIGQSYKKLSKFTEFVEIARSY